MVSYKVRIGGKQVEDDGLSIDLGKPQPEGPYSDPKGRRTGAWSGAKPLPPCPDCGGRLAGHPSGTGRGGATCDCGSTFDVTPTPGHLLVTRRRYHEIDEIREVHEAPRTGRNGPRI